MASPNSKVQACQPLLTKAGVHAGVYACVYACVYGLFLLYKNMG